jgi:hypothetical protein
MDGIKLRAMVGVVFLYCFRSTVSAASSFRKPKVGFLGVLLPHPVPREYYKVGMDAHRWEESNERAKKGQWLGVGAMGLARQEGIYFYHRS